ncbi:putative xyloglucan-specific endo-beta-1,4-glucanase A [Lachnellula willkommii]|uniref:Putative xyloglucan-specific endo-beta-1,4-glucanase A n=1 Tax=Lachnellula willkommii TaxID=215461 RepID=A0A559MMY3_9HELO|nr:putative xyloglucan-specific endo-beta-1,4-glucanase A [Lachnellula willkommii]
MKFTQAILPLVFTAAAVATPTPTLDKRATTICGQWDSVVTGAYTVYQDLWNEAEATSGSQCSTVTSLSDSTLVWSTSWTWAGASNQVKSYANAVVSSTTKLQFSAITSIPTTWKWSYTGSDIVADVSYDIFTSSTATGSNEYEIMIWLAALGGAGPISSTGSSIATVTIDGVSFDLYSGENGSTQVYSFVAASEATDFSGDLLNFFNYLETSQSYPSSQYLLNIGAGSEPFTGTSAVFTTTAYSAVIN